MATISDNAETERRREEIAQVSISVDGSSKDTLSSPSPIAMEYVDVNRLITCGLSILRAKPRRTVVGEAAGGRRPQLLQSRCEGYAVASAGAQVREKGPGDTTGGDETKCLQFADNYLEATTRLQAVKGGYAEMLNVWKDKLQDLECEKQGLEATIIDDRAEEVLDT